MNTALNKAFAESDRSYSAAKASMSTVTDQMLAQGPGGVMTQHKDLFLAREQLLHYTGWVYACVRPIAQRIARQTIHVGRPESLRHTKTFRSGFRLKSDATGLEPLEAHPLLDLLADPNDLMVAWSLIYTSVVSLELTGRCLWWLPKKKQIWPIPSSWIVGQEGSDKIVSFTIRPPKSGEAFPLPAEECAYIHYPSPSDPHDAVSPLQAIAGAVTVDEAITDSQAAGFRRGIHPSHAIILGKQPHPDIPGGIRPHLTGPQQRQVIGAILRRYQGSSKHGEPIILDGMIEDIKRLSNTPTEMDWINSGKAAKERISQAFGTSPIIMGEIEGANRASATVADRHFVDFTINPKIELISQCLTEFLAPMFGGDIKVWIEPCHADDAEMNLQWATLLSQNGVLTAHELRKLAPFKLLEESAFDNQLVGGQNMQGINPVEQGIRSIVQNELGGWRAKGILEQLKGNGNGRRS